MYPDTGNKKYIAILSLAAKETEDEVEHILKLLLEQNVEPNCDNVIKNMSLSDKKSIRIDPVVSDVKLSVYDSMLSCGSV
jgi:hypothetical protein